MIVQVREIVEQSSVAVAVVMAVVMAVAGREGVRGIARGTEGGSGRKYCREGGSD